MKLRQYTRYSSQRYLTYIALALLPYSVQASEYGCKVLLCLANPGGPKQYAECIPSIDRLFDDLRHGHAFPSCDLADGNDGSNFAKPVSDPYDPCPAGMEPARADTYVVQGTLSTQKVFWRQTYNITGTPTISQPNTLYGGRIGSRACVAHTVGQYAGGTNDNYYPVYVYQTVVWQPPQSPRAIDVYINSQLYKRVHW